MDSPDSQPPAGEDPSSSADLQTLSFLLNHQFSGTIDPNLIVSADVAMASSFFKESMETFEALSMLGESMDEHLPESEYDIYDPDSDGSVTLGGQDDYAYDGESAYSPADEDGPQAVLGGKKLSFGSGTYDISQLAYDRLLVAASENMSISGSLTFTVNDADDIRNELIFLSAGGLNIDKGSSIRYEGESLGVGSFASLNIVDVDLYAQDEISLRSLDRIVLNNVDLHTSGSGLHDRVEFLAHQEISVDGLRFNEHVKRIAMEANTVNLRNLNFPAGSHVNLNSAHGPLDGKYPNFNSVIWGRVNFIKNIRYAENVIMSRPAFDTHGGNISIGRLGN